MRRALGLRCYCSCGGVVAGDVVLLVRIGLGSSVIDNVFGVLPFFPFPFVVFFRSNKQCIFVIQIITLSGFSFCISHKFIQVVFPSFGRSSCSPLSLCRDDASCLPLGSFSGPSFLALCDNSESLAIFQFLLCLDPTRDVVCQQNISIFRASFCIFSPMFYIVFLACCAFFIIIE